LIDAYAHIGPPRFGTAEEVLAMFDRCGIEKGNLVLAPGIPDLEGLARARHAAPDRIRCFGIPFGPTPEQRLALAEIQVEFGILGMRLMHDEVRAYPSILALLVENERWLFAINPWDGQDTTRTLLQWLEAYPKGRIASPHFLTTRRMAEVTSDEGLLRSLFQHPRFFGMFSRHGGASRAPYPHPDLRPWVDDVLSVMSWDRLLWASEFPVLYQRGERVDLARDWVRNLGLTVSPKHWDLYTRQNADRLFFSGPAPGSGRLGAIPSWVRSQYDHYVANGSPVPVLPTRPLDLPMPLYGRLLSAYLREAEQDTELTFGTFLARQLQKSMDEH
jgi:hypothetical protein